MADPYCDALQIENAKRKISALRAELEEARETIVCLLECPDIADSDYKDEVTHEAERIARAFLSRTAEDAASED